MTPWGKIALSLSLSLSLHSKGKWEVFLFKIEESK
jgi:hypothetical protein